jgi:thiol-disulfide isomerase/thioredoxin
MSKVMLLLLLVYPVFLHAQTRTIVDDHKKFVYTDTGGVTGSYIHYFGDAFVPGPLTTYDGLMLRPPDTGEVVVYNFWFTYCAPCIAEIPTLNRVADEFRGRSVRFVGITWDGTERLKAFLATQPFRFGLVQKTKEEIQALKKVSLYPCTIITNRNGKISFVLFGRATGEDQEALYGLLSVQITRALKG